jgi:hypothetical protein
LAVRDSGTDRGYQAGKGDDAQATAKRHFPTRCSAVARNLVQCRATRPRLFRQLAEAGVRCCLQRGVNRHCPDGLGWHRETYSCAACRLIGAHSWGRIPCAGDHQTQIRGPIRAVLMPLVDLGAWFSLRLRPSPGPFLSGRRHWRPSQALDPAQDAGEQGARYRHLGELKDHVAAMADDPGADLHELLAQRGQ